MTKNNTLELEPDVTIPAILRRNLQKEIDSTVPILNAKLLFFSEKNDPQKTHLVFVAKDVRSAERAIELVKKTKEYQQLCSILPKMPKIATKINGGEQEKA
jgi:hypothetical protein